MSDPVPAPSVGDALKALGASLRAMLPNPKAAAGAAVSFTTPVVAWLALALATAPHMSGCSLPPMPIPGPVVPTDALTKAIRDAYATDPDPAKVQHAAQLATVYRQAVAAVNDPSVATIGDLYSRLKASSNKLADAGLLPANALPKVRDVIEIENNKAVPTAPSSILDGALRNTISPHMARVATALESCK